MRKEGNRAPPPSMPNLRLKQQTLRPTERHCGSVGRWSGFGREDHTLEGLPTGNNAPSQVPTMTYKQERWLRWSPQKQETSTEAHSGGCHKQGGCPEAEATSSGQEEANPAVVRIGRWANAAGRMQVKVADCNNNKRSDRSPTYSDRSRVKQGSIDDSHTEHEPQAVSALMLCPAVSEPQAVSIAASSACFIFSFNWVVSCSYFTLIYPEAADTEEFAERCKKEQIEVGPLAYSTGCGLDEVAEIDDAGTTGWVQDEVADYNNNNNMCSDLILLQVRTGRWAEIGTVEVDTTIILDPENYEVALVLAITRSRINAGDAGVMVGNLCGGSHFTEFLPAQGRRRKQSGGRMPSCHQCISDTAQRISYIDQLSLSQSLLGSDAMPLLYCSAEQGLSIQDGADRQAERHCSTRIGRRTDIAARRKRPAT
jgi:hypothetical protein